MNIIYGGVPEWPKGADCKSVVTDFDGSNPSSPTTSEQSPLCSDFFFVFGKKKSSARALAPLFRKRTRSARRFGCKRPHNGSRSLPPFCGRPRSKRTATVKEKAPIRVPFLFVCGGRDCSRLDVGLLLVAVVRLFFQLPPLRLPVAVVQWYCEIPQEEAVPWNLSCKRYPRHWSRR